MYNIIVIIMRQRETEIDGERMRERDNRDTWGRGALEGILIQGERDRKKERDH